MQIPSTNRSLSPLFLHNPPPTPGRPCQPTMHRAGLRNSVRGRACSGADEEQHHPLWAVRLCLWGQEERSSRSEDLSCREDLSEDMVVHTVLTTQVFWRAFFQKGQWVSSSPSRGQGRVQRSPPRSPDRFEARAGSVLAMHRLLLYALATQGERLPES